VSSYQLSYILQYVLVSCTINAIPSVCCKHKWLQLSSGRKCRQVLVMFAS